MRGALCESASRASTWLRPGEAEESPRGCSGAIQRSNWMAIGAAEGLEGRQRRLDMVECVLLDVAEESSL